MWWPSYEGRAPDSLRAGKSPFGTPIDADGPKADELKAILNGTHPEITDARLSMEIMCKNVDCVRKYPVCAFRKCLKTEVLGVQLVEGDYQDWKKDREEWMNTAHLAILRVKTWWE